MVSMLASLLLNTVGLFVATLGGSIVTKAVVKKFPTENLPQGYENAGSVIGYLERSLVYIFLILQLPSMVGFLLTMKAVYRFGDIQGDNNSKMKISEYFIIGTMTSLLWCLLVYILFNYLQIQLNQ